MTSIIKAEHVSKQYRIGSAEKSGALLRDVLWSFVRAPFRRNPEQAETIWALKDINFAVQPGEIVGVIGRNGAGKSTLLKILSRITDPTGGRIELKGRIASLIEVGTGFHPELTGRENIFLNGAIMGMTRQEIARKFDEIVAFAEVERFLDTPVKRYSSGMYLRLAFAVAAHLEPEILLVDEVLAVGDARFQRKCLDKMQDVGRQGRTVLFVSHNMPAITRLCPRTVLIDRGEVIADGPSHKVVGVYLGAGTNTTAQREWTDASAAPGNEVVRLRSVRIKNERGETAAAIDIRESVGLEMDYEVLTPGRMLAPIFHLFNEEGVFVFAAFDADPAWLKSTRPAGRFTSTAWIPGNFLSEGTFIIAAAVSTLDPTEVHVYERDVIAFQVIDSLDGNSARREYAGHMPGVIRPLLHWTTDFSPATNGQTIRASR